MKADDNKEGIADALKAMYEACQKGDFAEAASCFSDAQRLSDDDSSELAEADDGDKKDEKKSGIALIFGKK